MKTIADICCGIDLQELRGGYLSVISILEKASASIGNIESTHDRLDVKYMFELSPNKPFTEPTAAKFYEQNEAFMKPSKAKAFLRVSIRQRVIRVIRVNELLILLSFLTHTFLVPLLVLVEQGRARFLRTWFLASNTTRRTSCWIR